jgi:ABC-type branched-subunit amino acid transport system permease subunit
MSFVYTELVMMAIYIVLASSFDLIIGCGGMFSIAHAAFFGIGAYSAALLTTKQGWPVLIAWAAGALICALLSLILGAIAVRVSSDYLVITSFGFLSIVLAILSNAQGLTGGFVGISGVPAPGIGGLAVASDQEYVVLYTLIAIGVVAFLLYLSRSPFGRTVKAIRDNSLAAEALGKRPTYAKVWVFSIAGGFAGIAGAMYSSYISFVSPDAFGNDVNVLIFAMVFIGGAGSIVGAVFGAVALTWIPALISLVSFPPDILGNVEQVAYGAILVAIVMLAPSGRVGVVDRVYALVRPLFSRRGEPAAAEPGEVSRV